MQLAGKSSSPVPVRDAAFNNAATIALLETTPQLQLADWQHTLDTNLTAMFLAIKYQMPAMLLRSGGGSLIFTSTFAGHYADGV